MLDIVVLANIHGLLVPALGLTRTFWLEILSFISCVLLFTLVSVVSDCLPRFSISRVLSVDGPKAQMVAPLNADVATAPVVTPPGEASSVPLRVVSLGSGRAEGPVLDSFWRPLLLPRPTVVAEDVSVCHGLSLRQSLRLPMGIEFIFTSARI